MDDGSWTVGGQVLAFEDWRPNFGFVGIPGVLAMATVAVLG